MIDSSKKEEIESENSSEFFRDEGKLINNSRVMPHPVIIQLLIVIVVLGIIILIKFTFPDTFVTFKELYEAELERSVMADPPQTDMIYEE